MAYFSVDDLYDLYRISGIYRMGQTQLGSF
jgi:hypothetical protein